MSRINGTGQYLAWLFFLLIKIVHNYFIKMFTDNRAYSRIDEHAQQRAQMPYLIVTALCDQTYECKLRFFSPAYCFINDPVLYHELFFFLFLFHTPYAFLRKRVDVVQFWTSYDFYFIHDRVKAYLEVMEFKCVPSSIRDDAVMT